MVTQTCGWASAASAAASQQASAATRARRKRRVIVSSVRSGAAPYHSVRREEGHPPYLPRGGVDHARKSARSGGAGLLPTPPARIPSLPALPPPGGTNPPPQTPAPP